MPGREDGPKYLNSPETPIYRKGEVLYNLHRAKGAIARTSDIYVVEGYTDVIAMAQTGIETAVATCGTALGEGHFRLASRFAERMVLAFDSDEAGARAAERAFQFLESYSVRAVVLILPEGKDPADVVRTEGAEALLSMTKEAVPLVEYMLRRTVARRDLSTVEGQSAAVAAALPMLEQLRDPIRQSEYGHLLAELAGVSDSSVSIALDRRLGGRPVEVRQAVKRASAQERVEREMLRLLARGGEPVSDIVDRLEAVHFQMARNRELFALVHAADGDVRGYAARSDNDKAVAALSALAVEPTESEPTRGYAEDVWARLQEFALKRRSTEVRSQLQKLNPQSDPRYDELFQQLIALDGELRRLRGRAHSIG
jgi:DNA primase